MAGKPVNIILPLVGQLCFQPGKLCIGQYHIVVSAISGGGEMCIRDSFKDAEKVNASYAKAVDVLSGMKSLNVIAPAKMTRI